MAEHVDKFRSALITGKTDIPPDPTAKTSQEMEAEKFALLEKRKGENLAKFRADLIEQYDTWVKDDSAIKKVEEHGVEFGEPGFIIEVFVADFAKNTSILVEDDIYKKITPYAKILKVSEHNTGAKANWAVGDIVNIGDGHMNVQINPMYTAWMDARAANQRVAGKEPPKHIKRIYSWILNGHFYALDKAKFLMDASSVVLTEESIRQFSGPYVFVVDEFNVGKLRVKGNPWA